MSKKQAIHELLNRKSSYTGIQNNSNTDNHNTEIATSPIAEPTILNPVNTENHNTLIADSPVKKKKATFDLDPDLHTELKIFAATQDQKMVEVVETALRMYLDSKKITNM